MKRSGKKSPQAAVVMGSESDLPVMRQAAESLEQFGIPFEMHVLSAHRTPHETVRFAAGARRRGIRVIIAGAGMSAHLPGVIAAITELPVIGVPVSGGPLQGQDSLFSIVQMPRGVPVATVAIGNAWNAGILAAQILGAGGSGALLDRVARYKKQLKKKVLSRKVGLDAPREK
ncbi:MAG TPA: 5-(carboxyamino)imidazole ribonucleotide mutase [Elusimicrobiota bacterium]|nr:5-(carboxyamino)imidazole ribonucleotide mutase [Elusimicrobiota bacterium]